MIATINTLTHFEHEVAMARIAWRTKSPLNTCYYIARAAQLYLLLDDHDVEYLENNSPDILEAFYEISFEIDDLRGEEIRDL